MDIRKPDCQYNPAQRHVLAQARAMHVLLHAANTLQALDALYADWIGYSILEDDPHADFDCVHEVLHDYIRELAFSAGVHVLDVWCDE